jgi:BirA family biotin operon repressor/biotin-[acetyl-CoA-carboxylase] ligase
MLDADSIRNPISGVPGARLDILEVFSEVESTNSYLLDQPPPTAGRFRVALADYQSAGRGRLDRTWQSPPSSGLCLSLAYTFERVPDKLPGLTLALGIGIIEALKSLDIDGISLKWPNDIMALDRKLGGILTEARNSAGGGVTIVAGVGLNVDLPESMRILDDASFKHSIVDLKECVGDPPARENLSVAIIESLFECMTRFESDGFFSFQDVWRKHDWLFGKKIVVERPDGRFSGIADGVDSDGALKVRTEDGHRRAITGTVNVLNESDTDP